MRIFKYKVLMAATVFVLGSAVASFSQMSGPYGVKFHTDFPFVAANTEMPAGIYHVRRLDGIRESNYTLLLQGDSGKTVMLTTIGGRSNFFLPKTQVLFDAIDGQYFLTEIRAGGEAAPNRVVPSKTYRRLMARGPRVRQVVVSTETGF